MNIKSKTDDDQRRSVELAKYRIVQLIYTVPRPASFFISLLSSTTRIEFLVLTFELIGE